MSLQQTAYVMRADAPDYAALQTAVDALGFDCKIATSYTPFKSSGFVPCILAGRESGFEMNFESAACVLPCFPHLVGAVGNRDVAITFRWSGDMSECACVLIVCGALARTCNAIVHYQGDDILYSADELIEETRAALQSL
jgi:hypothetical protein